MTDKKRDYLAEFLEANRLPDLDLSQLGSNRPASAPLEAPAKPAIPEGSYTAPGGSRVEKQPQGGGEDLLTKAIYALGPGVLAMATGETGAQAAVPAQKGAYALREQEQKDLSAARKAEVDAAKAERDIALKIQMQNQSLKNARDIAETNRAAADKRFELSERGKNQRAAAVIRGREEKQLPQNVYAAATYGKRLEDANQQMQDLIEGGYDPTSIETNLINKLSPEVVKSQSAKLMDQSQRNFINAVLRRESGAAISPTEFDSANKQYFPQIGDTPDVLAQKERNRDVALAGLKSEGAKAWGKIEGNLPAQKNSSGARGASGKAKRVVQNGIEYILNEDTGEYE